MGYTKRNCDNCEKEYMADNRNLKRGWGLCCSKKCAAKKREKSRPDYDPATVRYNNLKRAGLLPRHDDSDLGFNRHGEFTPEDYHNSSDCDNDQWGDCEHGIHD